MLADIFNLSIIKVNKQQQKFIVVCCFPQTNLEIYNRYFCEIGTNFFRFHTFNLKSLSYPANPKLNSCLQPAFTRLAKLGRYYVQQFMTHFIITIC